MRAWMFILLLAIGCAPEHDPQRITYPDGALPTHADVELPEPVMPVDDAGTPIEDSGNPSGTCPKTVPTYGTACNEPAELTCNYQTMNGCEQWHCKYGIWQLNGGC